jgi:hypothetical protein
MHLLLYDGRILKSINFCKFSENVPYKRIFLPFGRCGIFLKTHAVHYSTFKGTVQRDFFHLPPVSTTQGVHLELRISPRIFDKI